MKHFIDIVVAWVDGADPEHAGKRAAFAPEFRSSSMARNARVERRFSDNEEINYCLRSIANFAPWARRIWLVTDNQFPASMNRRLARQEGVTVVDHRDIFAGHEDLLPTFNSLSIETMLWRIPGLAERFVYFNDDMFLTRPTLPETFFQGRKPVLRGRWTDMLASTPPSTYTRNKINAGKLLGYEASRQFSSRHMPYPMVRSTLRHYFEAHPDLLRTNAGFRFRDNSQFATTTLFAHLAIGAGSAILTDEKDWVHFSVKFCKTASPEELTAKLRRVASGKTAITCINYLEKVVEKVPDATRYLDQATGPRRVFERRAGPAAWMSFLLRKAKRALTYRRPAQ